MEKLRYLERDGRIRKGSAPLLARKIEDFDRHELWMVNDIFDDIIDSPRQKISWAMIDREISARVEARRRRVNRMRLADRRRERTNDNLDSLRQNIRLFNRGRRDSFNVEISGVSLEEVLEMLKTLEERFMIQLNNQYYTVTNEVLERLKTILISGRTPTINRSAYKDYGSDTEILLDLETLKTFNIIRGSTMREKPQGAFFPYYHNLKGVDLSAYGVYTDEIEKLDDKEYKQIMNKHCFITALERGGMEQKKINKLKTMIVNRSLPKCNLKEVCEKLDIGISLKQYENKHNNEIKYNYEADEKYHIGLMCNHYFLIEKTEYNRYPIEHYFELEGLDKIKTIYKKRDNGYRREKRPIDSYELLKILVENEGFLTPINKNNSRITETVYHDRCINDFNNLDYMGDCVRPFEKKLKEEDMINLFFDFEAYPDKKTDVYIPYLCAYTDGKYEKPFYGVNCGYKMLKDIHSRYGDQNIRMIAHNLAFDFSFLIKNLHRIDTINNGKTLYQAKALFKPHQNAEPIKLMFKDSLKLIASKLSKFPKMFFNKKDRESMRKEVMPYNLYTKKNIDNVMFSIKEGLEYLEPKDHEQFKKNIDEWGLREGDKYDIVEYSARYCLIDCKILEKGYNIFRKWVLDDFKIDIDHILTSASLADHYLYNEGCYIGCNELSGTPQQFIQGCCVGGRVMCRDNRQWHKNIELSDFDAVSLYPSAMERMKGFLKGVPKVIKIKNLNMDFLNRCDGYFIDIKVISVNKNRHFPLLNFIDSEGIRQFTNAMEGEIIRVDNITLEDLIKFQKIEFKIIRGYYFDEGFNTTIKNVIRKVFDKRRELKAEGNSAEMIYKLIMNSGYGKNIMKEHDDQTLWMDSKDRFNNYLHYNYNSIKTYTELEGKYKIEAIQPINDHFNRCHIGAQILSMSKRIMNEVMTLAEDNGIKIYYQDTDSMHIEFDKVELLGKLFKKEYGRELIGEDMGQFHTDFKMDVEHMDKVVIKSSIRAIESYFIGKKTYADKLKGYDKEGNEYISYHLRFKGIPNSCLYYTARRRLGITDDQNKEDYEIDMMAFYDRFFDDPDNGNPKKKTRFDLLEGGTKTKFKYKDGHFLLNNDFTRTV